MIGHNRIGAGAYTSAIVQEAKKDWQYYEAKIAASEECTGRLYREYKEGGAWKEKYKTWTDACVPLGKSRSQVDKVIAQDVQISSKCANVDDKKEEAALKKVEAARAKPEPTAEPKAPEEPEKPAVHSADEVKVEAPKPKPQNGVPKYQHAFWGEVETSFGRSLNRADELNRICPSPTKHALFIHQTKTAMETLHQWRESVK